MDAHRRALLKIYRAALDAVDGRRRVREVLGERPRPAAVRLIAIGKAADAMAQGAFDAWEEAIEAGLLITKRGHVDAKLYQGRPLRVIESGHPVPDAASLEAGAALLEFLAQSPVDAQFLFLISGGASSLVEALAPGATLEDLQALNRHLLASGADIQTMNRLRKAISRLKGGRLAWHLKGRRALVLLISDVEGDDPATVGSGLLVGSQERPVQPEELPPALRHLLEDVPPAPKPDDPLFQNVELRIIARNADALAAAAERAQTLGYTVHRHSEFIHGDAIHAGERLARQIVAGPDGVHLWGGEPTVELPPEPGRGGRMQALALAAAPLFNGLRDVYLLAAGTDGTDGPGEDAGALVDAGTISRSEDGDVEPESALERADAGTALAAAGDLIQTGPTGTNVMDIMIGLNAGYRHVVMD
jgi:glycerate 2-kinase